MKKRLKQALDKPYLCEVQDLWLPEGVATYDSVTYPFVNGDTVLMLGEIEQMPGHVAVVTKDGKTHFGYHMENFRKLTREES
jgi:hypothetical protein